MGLFDLFSKRNRTQPLNSRMVQVVGGLIPPPPDFQMSDFLYCYGGKDYASYIIYACITARARALAQAPLKFFSESGGELIRNTTHPINKLFRDVNPEQTLYNFIHNSVVTYDLTGNCPWSVERNRLGTPVELWIQRPDIMNIKTNARGEIVSYVFKFSQNEVVYDRDDIIHIKEFSPSDPYYGMPPMLPIVDDIKSQEYAKKYNENFFFNGASPSLIINVKEEMSPESAERAEAQLKQRVAGYQKAHTTMLLEGQIDVHELSHGPRDAEFLQQMERFDRMVRAIYKVPRTALGDMENAGGGTSAKIKQRALYDSSVIPTARMIESYISEFIVPMFPNSEPVIPRFDFSAVDAMREDADKLAARGAKLIDSKQMTISEVRRILWNLEPYTEEQKAEIREYSEEKPDVPQQPIDGENYNDVRDTFRVDERVRAAMDELLSKDTIAAEEIKGYIATLKLLRENEKIKDVISEFEDFEEYDVIDCDQFLEDIKDAINDYNSKKYIPRA